tara:strand:- start:1870 stop:3573 length:1704 start_codon:yes stop_codon:yes gene_type:complete
MRFVIREYLSYLKEDKELDYVLSELLLDMKIPPLVRPEKGRQDGVDIAALGVDPKDKKKKLFLFIVKQGDISRTTWDDGKNSVRASLNEIFDVYLNTRILKAHQGLPIRIIVSTNGYLSQNVQVPWVQYTNGQAKEGIEIDFWGIDELTTLCERYFFAESLFPAEHARLLHKTLAFIELNDYELNHFEEFIDLTIEKKESKRGSIKQLKLLNLCLNMIWVWGKELNNLKPVFNASEILLIKAWHWLETRDFLSEKKITVAFHEIRQTHTEIGFDYFARLRPYCAVRHSLNKRTYNYFDYSLVVWEQIGIISTIGLSMSYEAEARAFVAKKSTPLIETYWQNASVIAESLFQMIDNNPPSLNPNYDEHCIEINLGLLLMYKTGHHDLAKNWLKKLISMTANAYGLYRDFPLFYTNEEKLLESHFKKKKIEVSSSILYTVLSEWCVILGLEEDFETLKSIIQTSFPDLDLQMWYPEKETYDLLFSGNASRESGSLQNSIQLPETLSGYKAILLRELELFNSEKEFTFYNSGFYYLAFLMSRHYRTYLFPHLWRKYLETPMPNREDYVDN